MHQERCHLCGIALDWSTTIPSHTSNAAKHLAMCYIRTRTQFTAAAITGIGPHLMTLSDSAAADRAVTVAIALLDRLEEFVDQDSLEEL